MWASADSLLNDAAIATPEKFVLLSRKVTFEKARAASLHQPFFAAWVGLLDELRNGGYAEFTERPVVTFGKDLVRAGSRSR